MVSSLRAIAVEALEMTAPHTEGGNWSHLQLYFDKRLPSIAAWLSATGHPPESSGPTRLCGASHLLRATRRPLKKKEAPSVQDVTCSFIEGHHRRHQGRFGSGAAEALAINSAAIEARTRSRKAVS